MVSRYARAYERADVSRSTIVSTFVRKREAGGGSACFREKEREKERERSRVFVLSSRTEERGVFFCEDPHLAVSGEERRRYQLRERSFLVFWEDPVCPKNVTSFRVVSRPHGRKRIVVVAAIASSV